MLKRDFRFGKGLCVKVFPTPLFSVSLGIVGGLEPSTTGNTVLL